LGGAFLHILNHSLFKALLFYAAGADYQQPHTCNLEALGGLIKRMLQTALLFMAGAIAISALHLLNGFISEFLMYSGMYQTLHLTGLSVDILLLFTFSGLAIIGGLVIFAFTKVFTMAFLGSPPRSNAIYLADETALSMRVPNFIILLLMLLLGFLPMAAFRIISPVTALFTGEIDLLMHRTASLTSVSLSSLIFLLLLGVLWLLRNWQQRGHSATQSASWGCGYTGGDPACHQ